MEMSKGSDDFYLILRRIMWVWFDYYGRFTGEVPPDLINMKHLPPLFPSRLFSP
jgi:hypothetical protein